MNSFFLYGQANTGKSYSILELSKIGRVFYVNMDNKALRCAGYNIKQKNEKDYFELLTIFDRLRCYFLGIQILKQGKTYRDVMDLGVDETFARGLITQIDKEPYRFIVVDGFTNCFNSWVREVASGISQETFGENLEKYPAGEKVEGKRITVPHSKLLRTFRMDWDGWSIIGTLARNIIDMVYKCAMAGGLDVIFIGNEKELTEIRGGEQSTIGYVPDFKGSFLNQYQANFDHIGRVYKSRPHDDYPSLVKFYNRASAFQIHCRASYELYERGWEDAKRNNGFPVDLFFSWELIFNILNILNIKKRENIEIKQEITETTETTEIVEIETIEQTQTEIEV